MTVRLNGRPERRVDIPIRASGGGGADSGDYELSASRVTFSATQTSRSFKVTATDDDVDDDGEWLSLSFGRLPAGVAAGSTATERVDLIDNDVPSVRDVTVSYASADYEATEGGSSATVTVYLSAKPQRQVRIPIVVTGKAGASSADYSGVPPGLTFGSSDTAKTFTLTATDDTVDDDGEWLALSFGSLPPGVTAGGVATERVDLIDDEADPTVTLALSPDSISENGGVSTVTASLSHASSAATTVTVSASPVSPAVSGDFTLSGATLTIAAGSTSSTGTVTITANDNEIDAPDKEVTVSGTASNPQGLQGDPDAVTLTIEDDDDPPAVSLSSSAKTVDEGAGSVTLTARLSAASGRSVTVDYATANGTAKSGADYTAASGTLTFTAGQEEKAILVSITDDAIDEPGETFTVRLSSPSNAALGSPSSSVVTIQDNDVPDVTVSYVSADYNATEGGSSATVTVTLSAAPQRQVTIPIVSSPGGATAQGQAGADYSGIPASVTFGKTDTSKTFTVTAADDAIDDDGEWVELNFGTLPDGVTAGSPATERVDLIDDEPDPAVTLALSPDSISENGGVSTVTASLNHKSSAVTTITVSAAPVSPAVSGDFTLSGATLTIAAGSTSSTGTVTITANDNEIDAPDKEVTISAAARNPQGLAGDPASLTLTIEDDDEAPQVLLSSA
ncbi:MAG: hypothetical protein F4109_07225, partial [Gammaproteobacteria bacterium]|nr:hypothetical protein [Gammaproteobacteria bacterium]